MDEPSVVQALLEERRGYVVHGLLASVAEVDAQLALFGIAVADEGHPLTERDAPSLETTDGKPIKKPAAKPRK